MQGETVEGGCCGLVALEKDQLIPWSFDWHPKMKEEKSFDVPNDSNPTKSIASESENKKLALKQPSIQVSSYK